MVSGKWWFFISVLVDDVLERRKYLWILLQACEELLGFVPIAVGYCWAIRSIYSGSGLVLVSMPLLSLCLCIWLAGVKRSQTPSAVVRRV